MASQSTLLGAAGECYGLYQLLSRRYSIDDFYGVLLGSAFIPRPSSGSDRLEIRTALTHRETPVTQTLAGPIWKIFRLVVAMILTPLQ
jgi:hypothetical protein